MAKHAAQPEATPPKPSLGTRIVNFGAAVVAVATLAVTLVATGFAVDAALPQTAELLADSYSGTTNENTPFSHDELVYAAVVTRDYTVGSNDLAALIEMLHSINDSAGTVYAGCDDETLLAAPDLYTLDADAISHLDDVYQVVKVAQAVLIVVAILAVAACAHVGVRRGRRALGRVFWLAGLFVLVAFLALGLWIAVDFNGFFSVFHSLFFAEGSWTFSAESLLITMYPTAFWMGMGAIWVVVTCLLSIISLLLGAKLRRRRA